MKCRNRSKLKKESSIGIIDGLRMGGKHSAVNTCGVRATVELFDMDCSTSQAGFTMFCKKRS